LSASKKFLRMMNPMNSSGHNNHDGIMVKMVIVFAALFISLWFSNQTGVKLNSEINSLEKERDMLKTRSKKLEINMTSMISGEKLAEAAKKMYGFKQPSNGQVIVVQSKSGFFGGESNIFSSVLNREN